MFLSTAKKLGVMEYKFCNLVLLLGDDSVAHPHGLIENLPVKFGNVEIPTNFVVLVQYYWTYMKKERIS